MAVKPFLFKSFFLFVLTSVPLRIPHKNTRL